MKKTKKRRGPPNVNVNPHRCTTHPPGKLRADPKSKRGFVNFNASAPCTITFKNAKVFGHASAHLKQGNNKRFIQIEKGHTIVLIKGCEDRMPRSIGAMSNPTDITVP